MNCMFPIKSYTALQTSWFYLIRHFNAAVRFHRLFAVSEMLFLLFALWEVTKGQDAILDGQEQGWR